MLTQLILTALLSASGALARTYTIINRCPQSISYFANGTTQGLFGDLAANGGTVIQEFPQSWSGLIYATTNGGNTITRAGFLGDSGNYWLVVDPNHFNTGLRVTPSSTPQNGFCSEITCDSPTCTSAFQQPPTTFPAPTTTPPAPPLFACAGDTGYTVTFCPSGTFPPPAGTVALHPNGNQAKCLDVRGAVYANGTPVQIYDCNGTPAQRWVITSGPTRVALAGTPYCLDAGSTPGNNVGMKIWQCFDNLPASHGTIPAISESRWLDKGNAWI
ncbi:ricin B lectin domain-containing protein [Infundibulicybe gibba]|nr:ricin B lectin domain-containing protein [Infundibulicybe gibba]